MPAASPDDRPDPVPAECAPSPGATGAAGLFAKYALLFAADVGSRGLRFLADIVLVRHFGPAVFGQLNVAQSLAVQGMGIATCGLDTAGIRDVAAAPASTATIAATVVLLRLVSGIIAWGALLGLTWLVPQYRDSFELAALYGISMVTGAMTLGWVAQGRGWANAVGLSMLATHVAYFGGIQLAVLFEWPPLSAPLALLAAEAANAVVLWLWIIRRIGPVRRPLPSDETFRFLRASLPIGAATILRGVIVGSDVLLLSLIVNKTHVGHYAAAFKVYSLGLSLSALYFAVLLPHLASRGARSPPDIATALNAALGRSFGAAFLIVAAGLLLAPTALRLLFGNGFEGATTTLQILLLALPLNLVGGHYRMALIALGRQRRDLGLVATGAIVHIAAKLVLIPQFGISGAAWGTLAGEAALLLFARPAAQTMLRETAPRE